MVTASLHRWAGRPVLAACMLALLARPASAASVVFTGDPTDPSTGSPYEILPGQPLVKPGADGRLGTADDVIDTSQIGDIDLVVRLGALPPGGGIPAPAAARGAVATGVAGARGGGVTLPFRVYLSDGVVGPGQPYGNSLAAADLEGLPVVVLLFADRDGDGVIGPSGTRAERQVRALRELDPVGREVAFFSGGVASGTIAVTAGARASTGGLTVVATAIALTGAYNPSFFEGLVPTGPVIMTAQPFLPEREPGRVFSPDLGPLKVDGTLNPMPHAAGVPNPAVLDLRLPANGSSPTADTARTVAGPAVCARIVELARWKPAVPSEPESLVLGTAGRARRARLLVVPVDRLGNPADPAVPLSVRVVASGPLGFSRGSNRSVDTKRFALADGRGMPIVAAARGAGTGELKVFANGALCQRIPAVLRAELMPGNVNARVAPTGPAPFHTISAAVAAATDRNGDGRIIVAIGEGIYREQVRVTRAVELYGAGTGRTVIDAGGLGPALALAHPDAVAADLTATGGTVGISIEAPLAARHLEARANIGAGMRIAAAGAGLSDCLARENGEGFAVEAPAEIDTCASLRNFAAGVAVRGVTASVRNTATLANGGDGIEVTNSLDPVITGNFSAGNIGAGLTLEGSSAGLLAGNRAAGNDGNGLRLNQSDGALVDGNDFSANGGYGMRIDRSTADFDAAAGTQDPPGSNDVSDNRRGALLFD